MQRSPQVKALLEDHKKATGAAKLPAGGYPDMGSGRLSALLPYAAWLDFNNAQRVHYNYVEGLPTIITFALISGLKYPLPTAVGCAVYALGREVFAYLYSRSGADARMGGAAIFDIALVGMLGGAVASAGSIAKLW